MNAADALAAARELQLLHAPTTSVMFHGFSMEPLLKEGDQIVLEKIDFKNIRIGDIITYLYRDKYPTRRVVSKKRNELGLWCDNWPERQFSTQADKVLAKVVSRERDGAILSHSDPGWKRLTNQALRHYRLARIKNRFRRLYQRIIGGE
ncbi:MAG: hypothetical protein GKR96_13710 [Gammaproteobacteria bacterium]|nr:hypothetical protein [Gammaproteobacteria bacterium]